MALVLSTSDTDYSTRTDVKLSIKSRLMGNNEISIFRGG